MYRKQREGVITVTVYVMLCGGCAYEYEAVGEPVTKCPKCESPARVVDSYTEGEGGVKEG